MVNFKLDWFLMIISSIVVLLPFFVGLAQRKMLSYSLKTIFIYILIATSFELIGWVIVLNHYQNHWVHNVFNIFEFSCWSYYFYQIFDNQKIVKFIKYFSISITSIVTAITFIDIKNLNNYNSIAYIITCFVLIALVLYSFYELLNSLNVPKLSTYPHFWISVGALLYFSGCFFVNLFSEIILFSKDSSLNKMWLIYFVLLFIFRIFLAIGLWFSKTPPQLSPSSK
jgi:hypothetical protein